MDGRTDWMDWILLRSLVQLEHLAVLKKIPRQENLRAGGKPCCCLIVQGPDWKRGRWKLYVQLCAPVPAFYAYKLQRVPPTGESPVAA